MAKDKSCQNSCKKKCIAIQDKLGFRTETITRDRCGHFIMMKGSVQQEGKAILSVHECNKRTSKYIKQKPNRAEKRNSQIQNCCNRNGGK